MATLVIIHTESEGGGQLRAVKSIAYYRKSGYKVKLVVISPLGNMSSKKYESLGVEVLRVFNSKSLNPPLLKKTISYFKGLLDLNNVAKEISFELKDKLANSKSIVISPTGECLESAVVASSIALRCGIPCVSIMQLPPFYGLGLRKRKILLSREIARRIYTGYLTKVMPQHKRILLHLGKTLDNATYELNERLKKKILRYFDLLIAVSKSIPYEMNIGWRNIAVLDPGVVLDENDLKLIKSVKNSLRRKNNIVLFSARAIPEKGIIDALFAFRNISKRKPRCKLAITGISDYKTKSLVLYLARELGIQDKVVVMGFLPRHEVLKLKAKSALHLYPSHEDSVSYSVLESLHLGTPVIAYDIPAIRFNYVEKDAEGIMTVKEFDIEGLADAAIEVLERPPKVFPPIFPSWREIMEEEVELIHGLVR